jgi:hypothetical protein
MIIRRFISWRFLLLTAGFFLICHTLLKRRQPIQKVRYKARHLPLYECPHHTAKVVSNIQRQPRATNVQQRILLIKDSNNHLQIADFLNYFKVPIRIETLTNDSSLLLELNGVGRFSLVIFANHGILKNLPSNQRDALFKYSSEHRVGIISFALSTCTECRPRQQALRLNFSSTSPIPFVARTGVPIDFAEPFDDWIFLHDRGWSVVLEAENVDGEIGGVILHKNQPAEQILFGHDLSSWPIKLAFLDTIGYLLGDSITGGLTR